MNTVASRPQALPKAVQVSEMLIREIAAGRIPNGARLQPERLMAEELGVAVGTLRRALAILEEKGLLRRVQGSGNYVQSKTDVQSVYGFFRLELREGGGGFPTADVLEVLRLPKDAGMPEIGPASVGHRIRRLRYLNDVPIAAEEIWLDGRFIEWVNREELTDSLYWFYKERLKLFISHVVDNVGVDRVPDWAPAALAMDANEPCGFVERVSYGADGEPAEYSRNWFNHEVCVYTSRIR